jgi:segregation and condensation protein A
MSGIILPMSLSPVSYQSHSYHVATSVFEGPLDLLLHLIERAELDITKLALAQVTDQYLEHMHQLPELMAEEVSAFLVIAAKLLLIKSEALLPRPPVREEGEEDPGEALARQLIIYRRYRKVAEGLENREIDGLRSFLRMVAPPRVEGNLDLSDVSLGDLVKAAQNILFKVDERLELKSVVSPPLITIRQKINLIKQNLLQMGRFTFRNILSSNPSRIEIVVSFLAVLELIKRHLVNARQQSLFGEIEIEPSDQWDDSEEFELEFGE